MQGLLPRAPDLLDLLINSAKAVLVMLAVMIKISS